MKYTTGLSLLLSTLLISTTFGLKKAPEKLAIGIKKRIPEAECTRKTKQGDSISVHYTGTLFEDGTEFDSSVKRGTPFEFKLGTGSVIKGWDLGLLNMCIGEKRKLVIPYDLAYGEAGSPPTIPAKATLVFETELIGIEGVEAKAKEEETKEEDKKDTKEESKEEKKAKKEETKKEKKVKKEEAKKEKKDKKEKKVKKESKDKKEDKDEL